MSLAPVVFALVCSIFGTTTELADHGPNLIDDDFGVNARTNHRLAHFYNYDRLRGTMRQYDVKRTKRETNNDPRCDPFTFKPGMTTLTHPVNRAGDNTYSNHTTCITTIEANEGEVILLTFVDVFEMEDRPPKCEYDFLEIRDGQFGYALPVYKYCGKNFPASVTSAGPYMWLKFKSDDSIEYAGFKINIEFQPNPLSRKIPKECYKSITEKYGEIASDNDEVKTCRDQSPGTLDIQWRIEAPENTRIYLNFTDYKLMNPNECEVNLVQIFGAEPNFDHKLAVYCGSVANPVTTKAEAGAGPGNIMYIRMYTTALARDSKFRAQFTSFRTLAGDETCDEFSEVDCEDGTCIDANLKCDGAANCRLKADEDSEKCKSETQSLVSEPHILVILVIFSLILSGMSFVFLFKCIRKLYQDHKYIKERQDMSLTLWSHHQGELSVLYQHETARIAVSDEGLFYEHLAKSCEDRLDKLAGAQLTLDPNLLTRDTEPRASLERENHTNEMYKQQRNKRKSSSIESNFLPHETSLDLPDEWPESVPIPAEDIRIEYKGRPRRSDTSKKEESLRSKGSKEEKKENRDVSVGAPDTKESGCQTRESLFQVDTAPSSDGTNSGSNSRGFSTFGYSGATIVRPSPAPANTSQITIELLRQVTPQESMKSQKKMDRRPMSSETTRSAPDVIIVSKPIG